MTQVVSKKKYKRNYLTNVIFLMRFPKILELSEKPPSSFQQKIINDFPLMEERLGGIVEVKTKEKDFDVIKEKIIGWVFFDKDKSRLIQIDPMTFQLEFRKYSNYDNFSSTLENVFKSFIELYPIKIVNFIALRFINQISLDEKEPLNWSYYINTNLVTIPQDFICPPCSPLRLLHYLECREESCNIQFTYGNFNSEYPGPISKKEFVLDYNCYANEDVDISKILERINIFHDTEDRWFEMSILPPLRKLMGVENK